VVCARIARLTVKQGLRIITFTFEYAGKKYIFEEPDPSQLIVDNYWHNKMNVFIVFEKANPNNWRMPGKDDDFTFYNIQPADTAGLKCDAD
jgi:hypothetical protein